MAKSKKQKSADAAVTRWLEGYRRRRMVLLWFGCIGSLLLSVLVLTITWWAIWLVLLVPVTLLWTYTMLPTLTWIGFGLLFVAHVTANRQYLNTFTFDEPGPVLVAAQFAAIVAGHSSLALFVSGPETARSQVKMLSLLLLTGPALVGLTGRLAKAAVATMRMEIAFVGPALALLLAEGKRVLVDDVARRIGSPHPPRLLRELLLIDGVILLTSGNPSLTVTDSLMNDVAGYVEQTTT